MWEREEKVEGEGREGGGRGKRRWREREEKVEGEGREGGGRGKRRWREREEKVEGEEIEMCEGARDG